MRGLARLAFAGLIGFSAVFGCAPTRLLDPTSSTDPPFRGSMSLPSIGQPTPIALASLQLPSHQAVEKALSRKREITGYRLLTEPQCQCLAATESTLANLLAAERQSVLTSVVGRRDREAVSRSILADVLALRAVDERNRSAAEALELFYRLTGAYFTRDRLDQSLAEIRRSIEDVRKAKETGLTVTHDESKLRIQEIELIDRKVQLDAAIVQLDEGLCQLLNVERDPRQPLWPGAELAVRAAAVDAEAAVEEGLRSRPDLALLELLLANVNEQTLGAIRGALSRIDPLMARPAPKKHMITTAVDKARVCLEAAARQEQLAQLLEARRREAEEEIRRAAAEVDRRLRQIGLAKDRLDQSQERLRRLHERRDAKAPTSALDIRAAQLETLDAEINAFQAVVEWKIAVARLKQSQGLLAAECGYTLPAAACAAYPDALAAGQTSLPRGGLR